MGIHYVNGDLVGDGELDAMKPEALLYEFKNSRLQLTGVEYLVDAETWDANHDTPPVLMGQMFNFSGSPNRYRIPAFYELHVWAWSRNPLGTFADWNTRVSCDDYMAGDAPHSANSLISQCVHSERDRPACQLRFQAICQVRCSHSISVRRLPEKTE